MHSQLCPSRVRTAARAGVLALGGLIVLGLGGCATQPREFSLQAPSADSDASAARGVQLPATGDWDDLTAAVVVAVSRVQMTTLDDGPQTTLPDGRVQRRWQLYAIDDSTGELIATAPDYALRATEPIELELEATLGVPGVGRDKRREMGLLMAVRQRLSQLAGVRTAPLDGPVRVRSR